MEAAMRARFGTDFHLMRGVLVAGLLLPGAAWAQGYMIRGPGQMPTYAGPTGNGAYAVRPPGQLPTYVNPTGDGGYEVQQPGQLPGYVNPTGNGGYEAEQPGGLPTRIKRDDD
jgi:hypothetical protein